MLPGSAIEKKNPFTNVIGSDASLIKKTASSILVVLVFYRCDPLGSLFTSIRRKTFQREYTSKIKCNLILLLCISATSANATRDIVCVASQTCDICNT